MIQSLQHTVSHIQSISFRMDSGDVKHNKELSGIAQDTIEDIMYFARIPEHIARIIIYRALNPISAAHYLGRASRGGGIAAWMLIRQFKDNFPKINLTFSDDEIEISADLDGDLQSERIPRDEESERVASDIQSVYLEHFLQIVGGGTHGALTTMTRNEFVQAVASMKVWFLDQYPYNFQVTPPQKTNQLHPNVIGFLRQYSPDFPAMNSLNPEELHQTRTWRA